jgi:hypothetical protein
MDNAKIIYHNTFYYEFREYFKPKQHIIKRRLTWA